MRPNFLLLLFTHAGLLKTSNDYNVMLWELWDIYETKSDVYVKKPGVSFHTFVTVNKLAELTMINN